MELNSRPRRIVSAGLLLLALAVFVGLAVIDIDKPWEGGFRGANGGFYHGNTIKHWMKLGLSYTRGGCVLKSVPVDPPRVIYNFHHPPTYPLLILPTVNALGLSERSIRLGALFLAIPAILFLWLIGRRLGNPLVGGFASLLYATSAMGGYFGPMVDADNAVITLSLATVWAFLRESDNPTFGRRCLTFTLLFATALMDWAGYWTGPALALIALASDNPRAQFLRVLRLATAPILALVVFGVHTGWILKDADPEATILSAFVAEMQKLTHAVAADAPSWSVTFAAIAKFAVMWFGPVLLILAALAFLPRRDGRASLQGLAIASALLLPGVIHALAFRRNLVIHDFWIIHSLPGIALLGGRTLAALGIRGWVGGGVAALLLGSAALYGVHKSLDEIESQRTLTHTLNAGYVTELARPGDLIATSESFDIESYYLDNFVFPHVTTPEMFAEAYGSYRANRWAATRLIFIVEKSRQSTPLVAVVSRLGAPIEHHHFLVWIFDG